MKRAALTLLATALLALASAPGASAQFGFVPGSFDVTYTDALGDAQFDAGTHPHDFYTTFRLTDRVDPLAGEVPEEPLKDQFLTQIPGLAGNPTAVPTCDSVDFALGNGGSECPDGAAVGYVDLDVAIAGRQLLEHIAVYNLDPPPGVAAMLGFYVAGVPAYIQAGVNPDPPYNITAKVANVSQVVPFFGADFTIWGNPADPAHDADRGNCHGTGSCPAGVPNVSFLTLPRACTPPLRTEYSILSWQGSAESGFATTHNELDVPTGFTGCEGLGFDPEPSAAPTTNVAESPSGFDFSIDVDDPGLLAPGGSAQSDLKKAVVTLPEGMSVNPASAGGLEACTQAQLAKETFDSAPGEGCPQAAKVASVKVTTPLLDEQLTGSIFLAEPYTNPLGTLLAGYLVIKQPERGIVVKLAGKIEADPATGRLVSSFDENPQIPFDHFEVSFPAGPRAALITPQACGTYEVRTELYPWADPDTPLTDTDQFQITGAPGGGNCPTSPGDLLHAPGFDAGVISPIAAAHSPFVVNLSRNDGSQRFKDVTLTPPQGLVAKLAGTQTCSEGRLALAGAKSGNEEQANPSCPLTSEVGNVFAAAGAGPAPYHAPGKVYLAGPYKGAPLSLAIVTPAVAGPFDLGVVVVRTALHVDPKTAEITAVSDPLPELLEGIPLDIRSASVRLDKPNFSLNGTSCDPLAVSGALTSTLGQVAQLSRRFQLAECTRLGFKPRMTLRLRGGTKRGKHPALTIALMPRAGDANIASVSVALPRSEFLENAHIRTVCTRPDFAADACPAGAIYGEATVDTPILDYDLAGHVYLRSSDNLLPDVVPDLRGPSYQPIKLETSGRTDSIRGGIRTTIDFVPDAPFTKAAVALQGGAKGLLVNSRNICDRIYRATVKYTAHNGLTHVATPKLRAQCGGRGKRGRGKRGGHRRAVR